MIEPNMDAYYEKLDLIEERRRDEAWEREMQREEAEKKCFDTIDSKLSSTNKKLRD